MALVEASGAVLTRDALMARVWPDKVVGENALQVQISALRSALGADRDLLRTVSGRGYQFTGEVRVQSAGRDERVTPAETRDLIRTMGRDNPLWGAPRIHGELLKLGIDIAQSTVAKYMPHRRGPPSPGWRAFLRNHTAHIAAIDLFVIPTIGFNILYGLVILRLERRRLVWTNVTRHPTAEWIARQITEAFPWDTAPRYIIRDRDAAYGVAVTRRLTAMGIRDRPIAPHSPWQNGHVERLIGSIRRECLDHVVVLGERHLRELLEKYGIYYNEVRTHVALGKDAPQHRPVQTVGRIASVSWLGGLHHQYARMA